MSKKLTDPYRLGPYTRLGVLIGPTVRNFGFAGMTP